MPLTHEECREAVAAGDLPRSRDTHDHLAACTECRAFAARVSALDRRAAALAPPPAPPRLADQVVAAMPPAPGSTSTTIGRATRWARATAIAAAVLLVAGIVSTFIVADDERDGGRELLFAAARHFEEEGAHEVSVDASTKIEIEAHGREADFTSAPPEVQDYMTQQWNRILAELDRQLDDLDRQIDEAFSEFDKSLAEGLGSRRPAAPPRPPTSGERPPDGARQGAQQPPDTATLALRVQATGAIDASAGALFEGVVSPEVGTLTDAAADARFAVSASGGVAATRTPDTAWAAAEAGSGPLGAVLLEPATIPSILRAADRDVRTRTEARGRTYVFPFDGAVIGDRTTTWRAMATLDGEGRVRRLRLAPTAGVGLPVHTEVTVAITGRTTIDTARQPTVLEGRAAADARSPFAAIAPAVRAALAGGHR